MQLPPQALRAVKALLERIPFFPLSALSMLAGCYILNNALALRPGQTGKLLLLLLTLNAYESLLIGLGLFLILHRDLQDEGRTLLLLEVLFLADVTLLHGECFASSFTIGILVSGAGLLLAVLKAVVVFRALAPGVGVRTVAPLGVPLLLLFATPGGFALLARSHLLSPAVAYGAWWGAAAAVIVLGWDARRRSATPPLAWPPAASAFHIALAYALPTSLLLHLGATAWVYHLDFHWANLGPVLLALGIARMLVDGGWPEAVWQYRLPIAAIAFSLGAPDELLLRLPLGLTLSPLRGILAVAGITYVLTYRIHGSAALAWGAGLGLLAGATGHSLSAMAYNVGWLLSSIGAGGSGLVPRTAAGWGVVAVIFAFVLLGLGALATLWKPKDGPPPEQG